MSEVKSAYEELSSEHKLYADMLRLMEGLLANEDKQDPFKSMSLYFFENYADIKTTLNRAKEAHQVVQSEFLTYFVTEWGIMLDIFEKTASKLLVELPQ